MAKAFLQSLRVIAFDAGVKTPTNLTLTNNPAEMMSCVKPLRLPLSQMLLELLLSINDNITTTENQPFLDSVRADKIP